MQEDIAWDHAEEHMWMRHRILVIWAREACSDPDRLILDPDPGSRSGRSLRIIGYSGRGATVITVILIRDGYTLYAASAWQSNPRDKRAYEARMADEEP